jgi:predicted Fe-Mo cluster-binding NifX family protein
MKVAVTAKGRELSDQTDPRFGRSPYFLIVDTESMEFEVVENENASAGGGAGIQSAQMMADKGVQAVITGNCGPNAFRTLEAADIQVFTGAGGNVREAVEKFKAGELSDSSGPNVKSHFGMQ